MRNYYQILEVKVDVTEGELKKAYHRLALKEHPDKWQSAPAEVKTEHQANFTEIQTAYEILSNPETRAIYTFVLTTKNAKEAVEVFANPHLYATICVEIRRILEQELRAEINANTGAGADAEERSRFPTPSFFARPAHPLATSDTKNFRYSPRGSKPKFKLPAVIGLWLSRAIYTDSIGNNQIQILTMSENEFDHRLLVQALTSAKEIASITRIKHPDPTLKTVYNFWEDKFEPEDKWIPFKWKISDSLRELIHIILIMEDELISTRKFMERARGFHFFTVDSVTTKLTELSPPYDPDIKQLKTFFEAGIPGADTAEEAAKKIFAILKEAQKYLPKPDTAEEEKRHRAMARAVGK